jgi:hypothetical protein
VNAAGLIAIMLTLGGATMIVYLVVQEVKTRRIWRERRRAYGLDDTQE